MIEVGPHGNFYRGLIYGALLSSLLIVAIVLLITIGLRLW
jgi:hypothetical protein